MTKKLYHLTNLKTGATKFTREMTIAMANELNRSLRGHNSPSQWITQKSIERMRKEQQQ